ncbi:MAG: glycosyltransferase family 9 protein [Gammaproteobacteria bacterium]|nr:glycosyltransferase family 9 protein [Gammaproteobacteria bacterium]
MKILVIKQSSLGDVLHASGHIRSIKQHFPHCELYLLTAPAPAEIYRHSPWVDEMILIDRDGCKKNWSTRPLWVAGEIRRVMTQVRRHHFDLAFDLQGLAKSVWFLYAARATKKFVKGRWPCIAGFKNKKLHAIGEIGEVLQMADIPVRDACMELPTGPGEVEFVDELLLGIRAGEKPVLIISPFSRWSSKDWPLEKFIEVGARVHDTHQVIFTGTPERQHEIDRALDRAGARTGLNLAGKLTLLQFAELVGRAALMLTGDSFPMHVAGAKKTPVIALFGPTDERRVGPLGERDCIIRVDGCTVCDKRNCPRYCLARLDTDRVIQAVRNHR